MGLNDYKCDEHKLDLTCPGCVNVWIKRHDKMLEFVRMMSNEVDSLLDGQFYSSLGRKLLKEIGLI